MTLTVGGPGITITCTVSRAERSLGAKELPWISPILLTGLKNGQSYNGLRSRQESAGAWQDQPNASRTWTVDTTYRRLVLNEILAGNETSSTKELPARSSCITMGHQWVNLVRA